ncbi:uncharacterized protein LOC116342540 [Contarinia nasturtii]|uniref:uncharacterized protein LOC116342540 n=1 Tax=Contarinia nasturtii TaxID=265458 RepID=UPI0012D46239|nr:uncharacterized protein LOC116342540 [Contarinia nasturtii]XP_031626060.1 uncharacterized protein LOC116342540 [Contarinia nasturtii]
MYVLKSANMFAFRCLIWIMVQTLVVFIGDSLSLEIASTSSYVQKDFKNFVTETSTDIVNNVVSNLSTTMPTATPTKPAEVLGTAAAYKLDEREPLIGCSLSEFTCSSGQCVPASKYCDRISDCEDSSDEPRFCTRCNRTYYGNLGMTNYIELIRPKDERLPFVCEMNFTAAGGIYGDIVQITVEGFSVGRFCSYVMEGCPEGYLQISEASQTSHVGGMWCGTMDSGPVVFYSETRTLILALKLLRPPKGIGYIFDFRISYKVLSRENAIVRFGGVPERTGNRNITSYYNKNVFKDTEQNEEDLWVMTTRTVNHVKNNNFSTTPKRNKDKNKKDRDRERDRDKDKDHLVEGGKRDENDQYKKNRHHFDDFSSINKNNNDNIHKIHSSMEHSERYPEKSYDKSSTKQSKGFVMNKPHGVWPFHSNKDINNYYGNKTEPKYYLGTLISGTHCSRIFSDCDKKACRLQSPNYPGIYPRNLTCYYAIRQHEVPPGKHALITVRQPNGNLMWIQTSSNKNKDDNDKAKLQLTTWDDCDTVQDFITIYDGYTTRDPVILKFCGGGGNGLAAATSSGPELLIEFVTSPFGTLESSPVQSRTLNGFHLEISVEFVDTKSYLYAKNKQMCEFWIRGTGHGELESVRHSLPPNTTCLYHLQGTESIYRPYDQFHSPRRTGIILPQLSRFKVWISVLKFNLFPKFLSEFDDLNESNSLGSITNSIISGDPASVSMPSSKGGGAGYHYPNEECNGMMRIWDGPLREVPICNDLNCERDMKAKTKYGQNLTSVIARFCYNRIPKSCDHGVLNESLSRPCTILESYVSSSDYVTLELRNIESTVLQPVKFKLKYEFVDYQQDGAPIFSEHECQRKFISSELERRDMGKFRSVRNVFLFGRGGAVNLNCVYRFESEKDERIRITIKKIVTSNRQCLSRVDPDTKRSYCFGDQRAKLQIMEQPTGSETFYQRGCACNSSSTSDLPIVYTSSSRALEVRFTATNMTAHDDPDNLNFEATYEFIKLPMLCKEVKRLSGTSGTINVAEENRECRTHQWIIEPTLDRYLFVRMNGVYLRKHNPINLISESGLKSSYAAHCPTKARFVFTNGEGLSITACPSTENSADYGFVEIFSSGWESYNDFKDVHPIRSISIEYIDPDDQDYQFTWFEIVPRVSLGLVAENCTFICPELDACVDASVFCDGVIHCPSSYDESFRHCSALLKLPVEILAGLFVSIILTICTFSACLYRKIKRSFRGSSILQTRLKSLSSMDTTTFEDKDVIC